MSSARSFTEKEKSFFQIDDDEDWYNAPLFSNPFRRDHFLENRRCHLLTYLVLFTILLMTIGTLIFVFDIRASQREQVRSRMSEKVAQFEPVDTRQTSVSVNSGPTVGITQMSISANSVPPMATTNPAVETITVTITTVLTSSQSTVFVPTTSGALVSTSFPTLSVTSLGTSGSQSSTIGNAISTSIGSSATRTLSTAAPLPVPSLNTGTIPFVEATSTSSTTQQPFSSRTLTSFAMTTASSTSTPKAQLVRPSQLPNPPSFPTSTKHIQAGARPQSPLRALLQRLQFSLPAKARQPS